MSADGSYAPTISVTSILNFLRYNWRSRKQCDLTALRFDSLGRVASGAIVSEDKRFAVVVVDMSQPLSRREIMTAINGLTEIDGMAATARTASGRVTTAEGPALLTLAATCAAPVEKC